MAQERRNDVGLKTIVGVFSGVVLMLLSLFIHAAWATANRGREIASKNEVEIAKMSAQYTSIREDLMELKILVRQAISYDRTQPREALRDSTYNP